MVAMSIIYQSHRAYGILGDYNIKVYSCSNCKHKLTYEDRTFNRALIVVKHMKYRRVLCR